MTKSLTCLTAVVTLAACGGTERRSTVPDCTYTYSDWGACVDSVQTRTATSASPETCVGSPVFTQACTTCAYGYSAWSECAPDETQRRAVETSSPTGCVGAPVTSQRCTYTPPGRVVNVYVPPGWDHSLNWMVQNVVLPRLETLIHEVVQQRAALSMDEVKPFTSSDQFLPGKLAIGFADLLLSKCPGACPVDDPAFQALLAQYRDLAHWVLTTPLGQANRTFFNQTWGMYFYMNAIVRLDRAGLLHPGDASQDAGSAITAADLDALKGLLEWRVRPPGATSNTPFGFVDPDGFLGSLPTNYYGVAFGISRNRALMGWEDSSGADLIFTRLTEQFNTFSGFGYSDETPGEGRFDRYSLLVMGEVSQRLIETGMDVPPQLRTWLRNAVEGQLQLTNLSGNGFEYGRSLGPYADTSFLEVLSAAAYLNVLTPEEKEYAYAFSCRVMAKYLDFWFDPEMSPETGGTVNMWKNGRRTDGYRAENRILGENLSLTHQLLYTTEIWNRIRGFKDKAPMTAGQFEAVMDGLDRYRLITFTQAPNAPRTDPYAIYDRKTLIVRDGNRVLSLPLINGGRSLYAFNTYYPVPQSTFMLDATPDLAWPQLLPELRITEPDSSVTLLKPLAYFKDITGAEDPAHHRYTVTYHQDELAKLTEPLSSTAPQPDTRIHVATAYTFEPGTITRSDIYTANPANAGPVPIASIKMMLGTYSTAGALDGDGVVFGHSGDPTRDALRSIHVTGMGIPTIEAVTPDNALYHTNNGPLAEVVTWTTPPAALEPGQSVTITWTLTYDPS
jgi:hypothetical protein